MIPQIFYFDHPQAVRDNLFQWLNQINRRTLPKNNWVFFRILVNLGFEACGLPFDQEQMEKDFALVQRAL